MTRRNLRARYKSFYLKSEEALAPYAQKNEGLAVKRIYPESEKLIGQRLDFQLDRDKIIHSRAFRRLMHKTQIVHNNQGDHLRTRLTHTLEVAQIARSISKILGLNEELTEAIALGHDLGHTPFGHIGERTLHQILSGELLADNKIMNFGGFKHNFQSVHIADNLEQWADDNVGFNLTLAVRDGILKHTEISYSEEIVKYPDFKYISLLNDIPFTLEGQVVKIADEIAQLTHDIEDGKRLRILDSDDFIDSILVRKVARRYKVTASKIKNYDTRQLRCHIIGPMVGYLIDNVVTTTLRNLENEFGHKNFPRSFDKQYVSFGQISIANDQLKEMVKDMVINSLEVSRMDSRAKYLIKKLYRAYWANPSQLPDLILTKYFNQIGQEKFSRKALHKQINSMHEDKNFARAICDHIAGMTDNYAFLEYTRLYMPE